MKTYTIHTKQGQELPELVPEGFSFWAFMFGAFWALYHRLWLLALGWFAVMVVLTALMRVGYVSEDGVTMVMLLCSAFLGVMGHDVRRWSLRHRGYEETDVAIAENQTKATLRFLDEKLQYKAVA